MLALKKAKILLFFCGFFFALPVFASEHGVEIYKAELLAEGDQAKINADIGYSLSPTVKEALQSGIPLVWGVRIKVWRQRPWLWDEVMIDLTRNIEIRYHALLNVYQATYGNDEKRTAFSSLQAALDSLEKLRGFQIPFMIGENSKSKLRAGIKLEFDREKLPLPLRPESYLKSDWYLSSDWYLWQFQN